VTGEPCRPDELRTLVAAILAAAWRVTSAVTSAPREQAGAAGRIIECHNTPPAGAVTRNGLLAPSPRRL
jgi:hypothetical protein